MIQLRRVHVVLAAALCAGALAAASPAGASSTHKDPDLLVNPLATVGAASAQGWDAVTIPGWRIAAGLPTVVRYGTRGFPRAARPWPAARGRLFAGGAGGSATLIQRIKLRPAKARTSYHLTAWLGGTRTSSASLQIRFLSANGHPVGESHIGPVGRIRHAILARQTLEGTLPNHTAAAQVRLVLATSQKNANGPSAPAAGFNRAVAGDLSLTVSAPVPAPRAPVPPIPHVPRFQHVFLFYFENQDYNSVIGNTHAAPYLNHLLPRSSLLTQFYAEEHPSDGNYLALAGGSTFGAPLDDPEEENPLYTIRARNLGDLLDAAHQTWKAYLQSASGPCDDTVHGYYWNDDQPMMYFADVRDRPAYCARHLVPLEALPADLARASTTPSFAWIAPNDCTDMEGCGIKAGDDFLARELGQIMRSPAWRTQRSLAIITFDEDAQDYQRPAQRVPTIILGSAAVRRGYASRQRYTHYSLLRTIEAALGLRTLTPNDRYAQPVNDIFSSKDQIEQQRGVPTHPAARRPVPASPPVAASNWNAQRTPTAWVANFASSTVTPVSLRSRKAGTPVRVGTEPRALAVNPHGHTIYVANSGSGTVTPISTRTSRPGRPIKVGQNPWDLAVTPNGRTVYVASSGSGTVTPISTRTDQAGPPIRVGADPRTIAISPNGKTAYVLNWGSRSVTPISTRTNRAGQPVKVGAYPVALAFGPRGRTAYVASFGAGTVTPISTRTGRAGRPIPAGYAPDALAVSRNGQTLDVVDGNTDAVTRISLVTRHASTIRTGYSPEAVAMLGSTAYVVSTISGTVLPVGSGRRDKPISVGLYSYPTALTLAGATAVVLDTYSGQVSLVDTGARKAFAPIRVGNFPVAVAISG